MTIKTESDHQGRPYVPGTGQSVVQGSTTRGPEVTATSTDSATGDNIPFATAELVGDAAPPSYNPSYLGSTTTASATATAISAEPTASQAAAAIATDNQDYNPIQTTPTTTEQAIQPAYPSSPPNTTQQSQVVGASHPINAGGCRPPPPGVPPGGRWVRMRHIGNNTWVTCGIISAVFCVLMCLPCGVWAFLCPCDERDAYLVNAKLFDEHGDMIGSARSRQYR